MEDHEDTLEITARLLRTLSYDVKTASSFAAALQAVASEEFDLMICDIELPDGSGLDLIRRIAERSPVKGIAMSGHGLESDVKKSKDAGFLEHLTKPVDLPMLVTVIHKVTT